MICSTHVSIDCLKKTLLYIKKNCFHSVPQVPQLSDSHIALVQRLGQMRQEAFCSKAHEFIAVDGSPRSNEAHQECVQGRLLYIYEEMKIYCDRPIVTNDTPIEMYRKF